MADIPVPPEAVTAAVEALLTRTPTAGGLDAEGVARWRAVTVLNAAAPLIAAAERERIRQLAVEHHARYDETFPAAGNLLRLGVPFADMIGDPDA